MEHRDVASLGGFARALVHLLVLNPSPVLTYLTSGRGSRNEPGLDQSPASDATAASRVGVARGSRARRLKRDAAREFDMTRRIEPIAVLGGPGRGERARGRGGGSQMPPRITRTVMRGGGARSRDPSSGPKVGPARLRLCVKV